MTGYFSLVVISNIFIQMVSLFHAKYISFL